MYRVKKKSKNGLVHCFWSSSFRA